MILFLLNIFVHGRFFGGREKLFEKFSFFPQPNQHPALAYVHIFRLTIRNSVQFHTYHLPTAKLPFFTERSFGYMHAVCYIFFFLCFLLSSESSWFMVSFKKIAGNNESNKKKRKKNRKSETFQLRDLPFTIQVRIKLHTVGRKPIQKYTKE